LGIIAKQSVDAFLVVVSESMSGSTSKLLDALGVGIPIWLFAGSDSDAASIVKESGVGVVTEYGQEPVDTQIIIGKLNSLKGENCAKHVYEKYDGHLQAAKVIDEIERLIDSRKS
jgi:hypothetical protein